MSIVQHLIWSFHSYHSKHGTRLVWALELPVLVQMNQLPEHHRSKSHDPGFRVVWSGQDCGGEAVERKVDWKAIADDWQQVDLSAQKQGLGSSDE